MKSIKKNLDKGPVHQRLGFRPNKAGDEEGDRSEVSEEELDLTDEEDYQVLYFLNGHELFLNNQNTILTW